jgi:hypothetical protein
MNKELLNVVKKLMKTHTAVSNFSCAINCEILCGNIVDEQKFYFVPTMFSQSLHLYWF